MKKIFLLTLISIISLASILAKSAKVQLITNVEEKEVVYDLYYADKIIEENTNNYEIIVAPLTRDSNTDSFSIYATGNKNSDMSVSVEVIADYFKTIINNNIEVTTDIKPQVNNIFQKNIFPAGNNVNYLVNEFFLSWNGNSDLPAGNYVSNVKIEYSIQ